MATIFDKILEQKDLYKISNNENPSYIWFNENGVPNSELVKKTIPQFLSFSNMNAEENPVWCPV